MNHGVYRTHQNIISRLAKTLNLLEQQYNIERATKFPNRSIDRSIDQIDRSLTRSLDRSPDRAIDRLLDRSIARPIARALDRSRDQSRDRSLGRSIARSVARSFDRLLDRSIARSISRSLSRLDAVSPQNFFPLSGYCTASTYPSSHIRTCQEPKHISFGTWGER